MEKILEIIAKTPLFKGLDEAQLKQIKQIAIDKFYNKGRIIFSEGDNGNGFYIVADGKIKIYKSSLNGKEQILHIYEQGNPFGEVPVFSGQNFPATAQTLLKSHLLFFPRTAFVDLITANPSLAMNMMAILAKRLREFTIQIENLSLKEVPGRLAAYLVYLTKEQNSTTKIYLPISKTHLASLLGTIPETISRILNKISSKNIIQINGRYIDILDFNHLESLAEYGKIIS